MIFHTIFVISIGVIITSGGPVDRQGKRLIKTSETEEGKWLTLEQIFDLIRNRKTFMDITDHSDIPKKLRLEEMNVTSIPKELQYQKEVNLALQAIDIARIEDFVTQFSKYYNRYHDAKSGLAAQKWLMGQVEQSLTGYTGVSSVQEFEHSFAQKSIIAKIEGTDPELKSEVVVLGSHMDSINAIGPMFKAPGGDDDASGSSVVLEALRVAVKSHFAPQRTIEFHWYAAEEVGLRGSGDVAQDYKNKNVSVVGMLNLDVIGYEDPNQKEFIGIYTDNAHPALIQFIRMLADEYVDYGKIDRKCGYACSDHFSFLKYGFPALMTAETKFHPYLHSGADESHRVSYPLIKEFAKLAIAYIVEFGEPGDSMVMGTNSQPNSQSQLWLPQQ